LFIGPIMWERLISFSVRGCARPSLSFTMLTISPSVCCSPPESWEHYGISVMSVTRTVPTLRFDCVVYLLHVLDRRFLGES
jgi:hypothetical protein